ncbi:desulfoferrodoxin [Dehalobacter sp. DCM]|uniref:desulfoferrodoxin n=1 Tax=Dehalobacter sp. DCM TaxID=2907827 RepID=UPI003081FBFC|nr:desulfoferrodoxin [Dehalobacter sp. DCM]
MTELREVYKCNVCGNVIEVIHAGASSLVCCGQPMEKLEGKTEDTGIEKHLPVVEAVESGIKVRVGSVEHPMLEEHYIQLIEVLTADKVCRAELKPGQKPEAVFQVNIDAVVSVREYCNLHGLWKTK